MPRASTDTLEWSLKKAVADRWLVRGIYDPDTPAAVAAAPYPVGTFVSFDKSLNVGAAEPIAIHLISQVTVRPTHRRRGILRTMMHADLADAVARGAALAGLTATEATIYGRFGFGPATFVNEIEVDTSATFALRERPGGSIHLVPAAQLPGIADQVYAGVLRTRVGAVDREHFYAEEKSGVWDMRAQSEDTKVRAAVHLDPGGAPDGFVAYAFTGWETPRTIKVMDLCAVTDDAYLGLWEYLGSIDLVDRITWGDAPEADPLPFAMRDSRGYRPVGHEDLLWLRILDPIAALEARAYVHDVDLVMEISDKLGYSEGVFSIEVRDGTATVKRTDQPPAVSLGVEELGSLYLGTVRASTMVAARRISASAETVDRLDLVFGGLAIPYTNTHF